MPTKDQVFQSLEGVRKKFDDPGMKEKFKGFKREMQFRFTDIGVNYVLSIAEDASATLKEGTVDTPNITVDTDSTTFLGVRNKTISGTQAYMSGKLKVKGAMSDLLKLQRLL